MDALVSQSEEVGHLKLSIREHRGTELMFWVPFDELIRGIGADCDDLDTPLVKIGSKFFPSPQLGDTVGSPMPVCGSPVPGSQNL